MLNKHVATVHNPTNFEPSDYSVEDYLDNRRPTFYGDVTEHEAAVKFWEADMLRVLGADWRAKSHRCVHCGNGNVRWITAVRHTPTGDVVVFGSDCTDRLGFANKVQFKLAVLQSRDAARKVRFKAYRERQAFIAAHPEVSTALAQIDNPEHAKNFFAKDVLRKLDQYGSLSDKQIAAVVASLARDIEYAARTAAQAVEVKGTAPSGRVEVTGTVLSTKYQESQYGPTLKMLVKLVNNSKVWLTVPSKSTVERGDTVTVVATFTVSKDDPSFAFGSRPTLVGRVAAEAK